MIEYYPDADHWHSAEPADHGFDSARLTDALEFAATQEITASKDLTEMIPKGERHPYDRQLG